MGWHANTDGKLYFHGAELINFDNQVVKDGLNFTEGSDKNADKLTVPNEFKDTSREKNRFTLSDSSSHLEKAGSLQASVDFINKVLHDKIIAQVIMATGFSSIIVGLLQHNSVIVNISGQSSIGKSIMSQLATSLYSVRNDYKVTATFDATPKCIR